MFAAIHIDLIYIVGFIAISIGFALGRLYQAVFGSHDDSETRDDF
jgi:hypothetical protein